MRFQFSHDSSTDKYGYLNASGTFVPFEEGGTDVSDTTATASTVLSGYQLYLADGTKTAGTIVSRNASNETITDSKTYSSGYYPSSWTVTSGGIDTSDATAKSKNLEAGYTAYVKGKKISGIANITHTFGKYTEAIPNLTYAPYSISTMGVNNQYGLLYETASLNRVTVNALDYYSSSLSKASLEAIQFSAGVSFGEVGLGISSNNVVKYDGSLTRSILENQLSSPRYASPATIGDDYCFFAGGSSDIVDVYDKSLTVHLADSLPTGMTSGLMGVDLASTYAVYSIARYSSNYEDQKMVSYNRSLTRSAEQTIASSFYYNTSGWTRNQSYSMIQYWYSSSNSVNAMAVSAFNSSFTKTTFTISGGAHGRGVGMDEHAFLIDISTVSSYSSSYTGTMCIVDTNLTRSNYTATYKYRDKGTVNVGIYELFCGGTYKSSNSSDTQYYNTVEAFYES